MTTKVFHVYESKVNITIMPNSLAELWLFNGSVDVKKHCLFCSLVLNLHYCFVFIPRERCHDMKCNPSEQAEKLSLYDIIIHVKTNPGKVGRYGSCSS